LDRLAPSAHLGPRAKPGNKEPQDYLDKKEIVVIQEIMGFREDLDRKDQ
jgi:hypothetical protein